MISQTGASIYPLVIAEVAHTEGMKKRPRTVTLKRRLLKSVLRKDEHRPADASIYTLVVALQL